MTLIDTIRRLLRTRADRRVIDGLDDRTRDDVGLPRRHRPPRPTLF